MDDLKATRELMEYLGELSSVEESVRNAVINQHLSSILRLNMQASQNADRTMPDGVISVVVGGVRVPLLIAEFKRMLGEGHCDPMVQASLSMQRRWKMNDVGSFYPFSAHSISSLIHRLKMFFTSAVAQHFS